ncbi:MAG: trypsin-like peptidase domain-containing protein [Candidatus Limiplasma sp.]|nr:trypsin-like peptidase domain-containing protein [Candidatus Limiplasma sp.]
MKHQVQSKKIFGYIAMTLVLAMVVTASTALIRMNSNATAEPVTLSQSATVVQSPFTEPVQKVKDSVVGVDNYGMVSRSGGGMYGFGFGFGFGGGGQQPDQDSAREVLQGSGSGVVIATGYVVTNYHVVDGNTRLEVTAGDNTFPATVVASDENLDVAVLKVEGLDLTPVTLGDSDALNVGDWAICIGNPLSFSGTTTVGVISALGREIKDTSRDAYGRRTEYVNEMIQTDAAINAGNSGGGMFNVAGELVGIPSRKISSSFYSSSSVEGIGMAIPINAVKPLLEGALSGQISGNVTSGQNQDANAPITSAGKPRIGVSVADMNSSNYAVASGILPTGAYVTEVESGSPAEKAGLKEGDIIVDVDDTVITSTQQMVSLLQAKEAGQTVAVKIYRVEGLPSIENYEDIPEGEYIDLTIELAILDNVKQ